MEKNIKSGESRAKAFQILKQDYLWDVVIIGGGAAGASLAVDAASRGFSTLLLESQDFCKGTAAASELLMPDFSLLRCPRNWKRLRTQFQERRLLLGNAPQVTEKKQLILPFFKSAQREAWLAMLAAMNLSAPSGTSLGGLRWMSGTEVIRRLPSVKPVDLKGGVQTEAVFVKPTELALSLLKTADMRGAVVLNHTEVTEVKRGEKGEIAALTARDAVSGEEYSVRCRMVFNAAETEVDDVRRKVDAGARSILSFYEQEHITVDSKCFDGERAALFADGLSRMPFECTPSDGVVTMGGTVRTGVAAEGDEEKKDTARLLERARQVLLFAPVESNVKALIRTKKAFFNKNCGGKVRPDLTEKAVFVPEFKNMISVVGGSRLECRRVAEDAMHEAVEQGLIYKRPCGTTFLSLYRLKQFDRAAICREALEADSAPQSLIDFAEYAVSDEFACSAEDIALRRLPTEKFGAQAVEHLVKLLKNCGF